ncbi:OLC1v1022967C1 [Oldenlandia corymbosa var. corymbosa]|uniref:OLC1v1022967C1 n=1 Tax=Oldenlandia corymbosa var. corymbosa TaxID=529605 RepID=A0AAV1C1C0_OLDCO|nr:OLC1v1022967C1 [Oldenlandia corymbosa var. corymbosa]
MMNPSQLSLKVIFISTSLLSVAVALKLSVPAITDFAVSEVPSIYNGILSWLKPPYLYLVINCIIITIVASSKLQSKFDHHHAPLPPESHHVPPMHHHPQLVVPPPVQAAEVPLMQPRHHLIPTDSDVDVVLRDEPVGRGVDVSAPPQPEPAVTDFAYTRNSYSELVDSLDAGTKSSLVDLELENEFVSSSNTAVDDAPPPPPPPPELEINGYKDEFVISKSTSISRNDSMEFAYSTERPPISSRFGHRRAVKASPEGGKAALGVSKPKRQDTLESTWKTITEGRAIPLTRHLRKSDTWERESHPHRGGRYNHVPPPPQHHNMSKSETFNDRGSRSTIGVNTNNNSNNSRTLQRSSGGSGGKLRKEPSLGQDELNRRVEAFIKKFNEEMRLQRQESLNQYMEMINRGAAH